MEIDPKRPAGVLAVIAAVLVLLFGISFDWDPTDTGNGPRARVPGVLSWILQRAKEDEESAKENPPPEEVEAPESETREPPRQRIRQPPRRTEPTTHLMNGTVGSFRATGQFAEVGMPGLTPGTHMTVSLYIPRWGNTAEVRMRFTPRRIDETGIFKAMLPRYVRNLSTGDVIDLSERRYQFAFRTDDGRFIDCGQYRYANMIEGRPNFWFTRADRVYCGNTDPVPPIEERDMVLEQIFNDTSPAFP
jgi:hypothetical protein